MTVLSDKLAQLASEDTVLAGEIDALIAGLGTGQAATIAALKAQLAQDGVDATAAANAVDAITATTDAQIAKAKAALSTGTGGSLTLSPSSFSFTVGQPATGQMAATGAVGTVSYTVDTPPAGTAMDSTGLWSGSATTAGPTTGNVTGTDNGAASGTAPTVIAVSFSVVV